MLIVGYSQFFCSIIIALNWPSIDCYFDFASKYWLTTGNIGDPDVWKTENMSIEGEHNVGAVNIKGGSWCNLTMITS